MPSLRVVIHTILHYSIFAGRKPVDGDREWQQKFGAMIFAATTFLISIFFLIFGLATSSQSWGMFLASGLAPFEAALYCYTRFTTKAYNPVPFVFFFIFFIIIGFAGTFFIESNILFEHVAVIVLCVYAVCGLPFWGLVIVSTLCFVGSALSSGAKAFGWQLVIPTPGDGGLGVAIVIVVIIPVVLECVVAWLVNRIRKEQEHKSQNKKATLLFAQRIALYNTKGAMTVVEDHADILDPQFRNVLEEIVVNLDKYRSFLPPAIQPYKTTAADMDDDLESLVSEQSYGSMHMMHLHHSTKMGGDGSILLPVEPHNPLLSRAGGDEEDGEDGEKVGGGHHHSTLALSRGEVSWIRRVSSHAIVALVHFELRGDLPDQKALCLATGVNILTKLCREHKGTLQTVMGPTALVTWGIDRPKPKKATRAVCAFACALRQAFLLDKEAKSTHPMKASSAPCGVSCAIASGETIFGAAGAEDSKHFCVHGPITPDFAPGQQLQLLFEAAKYHNAIVISATLHLGVQGWFHCRGIDAICSSKDPATHRGFLSINNNNSGSAAASVMNGSSSHTTGQSNSLSAASYQNNLSAPSYGSVMNGGDSSATLSPQPELTTLALKENSPHHHPTMDKDSMSTTTRSVGAASGAAQSHASSAAPQQKDPSTSICKVYEVVAPVTAADSEDQGTEEEWMYTVAPSTSNSSNLFGICEKMNSALDKYCMGHHEAALHTLSALTNQQRQDPRLLWLEHSAGVARNRGKEGRYARELGWDFKGILATAQQHHQTQQQQALASQQQLAATQGGVINQPGGLQLHPTHHGHVVAAQGVAVHQHGPHGQKFMSGGRVSAAGAGATAGASAMAGSGSTGHLALPHGKMTKNPSHRRTKATPAPTVTKASRPVRK